MTNAALVFDTFGKKKLYMGLVYADIELINLADETLAEDGYLPAEKIRKTGLNVMADSGAIRLAINEDTRKELGLRIRQAMDITLADGTKRTLNVAGPVRIKFRQRDCITDAFILPGNEEVLLGAVPMELMDLVIFQAENRLDYNPSHPDGPVFSLK
jgi:clan AA aspartic protease